VEPVRRNIKPWTQEDQESSERVSLFMYHATMPDTPYAESIARLLQIVKNTLKDFPVKEDQDLLIRRAFQRTPREALEILNDVMNEKEKQWQCLKTIEKLIPKEIALLRLDQVEREFIQKIGEILKDAKFSNRYLDFSDFSILSERANFGVFREQIRNAIPDAFILKNWHNQTCQFIEQREKEVSAKVKQIRERNGKWLGKLKSESEEVKVK
jgi:hypothetical protein